MNPEESIGAAHAACFSMALASSLERAGHPPDVISTPAGDHTRGVSDSWPSTRPCLSMHCCNRPCSLCGLGHIVRQETPLRAESRGGRNLRWQTSRMRKRLATVAYFIGATLTCGRCVTGISKACHELRLASTVCEIGRRNPQRSAKPRRSCSR